MAALAIAAAACGDESGSDPNSADDLVEPDRIDSLKLAAKAIAVTAQLELAGGFHVAGIKGVGTLLGSAGGLYQLSGTTLKKIDGDAVVGLATLDAKSIVVARAKRVDLWTGTLQKRASFFADLDGSDITAVASQGAGALWIGTKKTAWFKYRTDNLVSFGGSIKGVSWLGSYSGAPAAIVRQASGEAWALRRTAKGKWESLFLSKASGGRFGAIFPTADGKYLGVSAGQLYHGLYSGDGALPWRPYKLKDGDSGKVEQLAADYATGLIWVVTSKALYRASSKAATRIDRPAGLAKATAASVGVDGALWLSDGKKLFRLVNESVAVTYAKEVKTFTDKNCSRCHGVKGPAVLRLDGYERLVRSIDSAVAQVEAAKMPSDGRALTAGDKGLLRRWRTAGMPH